MIAYIVEWPLLYKLKLDLINSSTAKCQCGRIQLQQKVAPFPLLIIIHCCRHLSFQTGVSPVPFKLRPYFYSYLKMVVKMF